MKIVFAILGIDTLACLGTAGYAFFSESVRVSMAKLPDTTWQPAWKIWFVMTVVAWIGAILLGAARADARKSERRQR